MGLEKEKRDDTSSVSSTRTIKRETWSTRFDFLLACIGFSVGLGNVWRFPYLCYKNGGGAFLIPYLICVILGGIPLFWIEVGVGQFMGEGGVGCWRIVPIMQGIGITCALTVFTLNCYYNVILGWAFYYFFASFTSKLPWVDCDHEWNSEQCSAGYSNWTNSSAADRRDPTNEFWEEKVLGISDGLTEVGTVKWDMCCCLIFAWIVVYFCIIKGIKSSGKVMYVTATSPYLLMTILLVRGVTLEGSLDGIIYYLKPDFSKLMTLGVWVDAGTQIFFSYSIALGSLTALGSYNNFHHNSYRDSILFALVNSGTSIFAGFVIFSVLGYMSKINNIPIDQVAASGPGLAFIAYPKAVAQLPISPLWSALFFLMVILLGLDSQFVGVEGFVTAIVDAFPNFIRKGRRKEILILIICIITCGVGVTMVTNGGMYVFQLFDYYPASRMLLLVSVFQLGTVSWLYGIRRFMDNLEMMYGFRPFPRPVWMVMWAIVSPLFCMIIFIMSTINYSELTYDRKYKGTYTYPDWAVGIGWGLSAFNASFIPLGALVQTIRLRFFKKLPWRALISPLNLKPHQLRPQDLANNIHEDDHHHGRENMAFSELGSM